MSRIAQQPDEVPYREQDHGFADDSPMYPDYWPMHLGHLKVEDYYGTKKEYDEEIRQLRERDARRADLGGFGFRA